MRKLSNKSMLARSAHLAKIHGWSYSKSMRLVKREHMANPENMKHYEGIYYSDFHKNYDKIMATKNNQLELF